MNGLPSQRDFNRERDYSFSGSAWERIGVEAPASRVHKLRMYFGEAEPRLH
jgi:hypothetical protein